MREPLRDPRQHRRDPRVALMRLPSSVARTSSPSASTVGTPQPGAPLSSSATAAAAHRARLPSPAAAHANGASTHMFKLSFLTLFSKVTHDQQVIFNATVDLVTKKELKVSGRLAPSRRTPPHTLVAVYFDLTSNSMLATIQLSAATPVEYTATTTLVRMTPRSWANTTMLDDLSHRTGESSAPLAQRPDASRNSADALWLKSSAAAAQLNGTLAPTHFRAPSSTRPATTAAAGTANRVLAALDGPTLTSTHSASPTLPHTAALALCAPLVAEVPNEPLDLPPAPLSTTVERDTSATSFSTHEGAQAGCTAESFAKPVAQDDGVAADVARPEPASASVPRGEEKGLSLGSWSTPTVAALNPILHTDLPTAHRVIDHGKTSHDVVRAAVCALSLAAAALWMDTLPYAALEDVADGAALERTLRGLFAAIAVLAGAADPKAKAIGPVSTPLVFLLVVGKCIADNDVAAPKIPLLGSLAVISQYALVEGARIMLFLMAQARRGPVSSSRKKVLEFAEALAMGGAMVLANLVSTPMFKQSSLAWFAKVSGLIAGVSSVQHRVGNVAETEFGLNGTSARRSGAVTPRTSVAVNFEMINNPAHAMAYRPDPAA
ncbi:hypothetical protein GGF32_007807 [Allomyces javanicus]|nr:hypothetical protein GGF32_007807 [Allomyces javanicus]